MSRMWSHLTIPGPPSRFNEPITTCKATTLSTIPEIWSHQDAYDEIVNATLAGTSFSGLAAIFERSHGLHIGLYGEEAAQQDKHKSPSNDFIMGVFMFDFKLRLPYYERTMMEIQPHMISIDHTFKLR